MVCGKAVDIVSEPNKTAEQPSTVPIRVSKPSFERLMELRRQRVRETGRASVTFAEVIEQLLERQP